MTDTVARAGLETLDGVLRHQATERPDATFLVFGSRRWTFAEVHEQASNLAAALAGLGVEPGDRIAIDLPNWPEFVVSVFAAAQLRAAIVPLNPGYSPRELQFMLRHSEASVAVSAEHYAGTDFLQVFESLLVHLPALQYLVTVGEEDLWYDDRIFQFEDLVSSGQGRDWDQPDGDGDKTFAIIYTSGTTGKPKGVMLSHANLLLTAEESANAVGMTESDVTLCSVPMFHIFGLGALLFGLVSGSAVVLQESFDAGQALELIDRQRVTVLHGVPTMFVMLLRHPDLDARDTSSLRTGIIAGAPVTPELARDVRAKLVPQVEIAYGMTETSPTVSITRPTDTSIQRSHTVGRPLPGVDLRIIGEDGRELGTEAVGELAVRGFNVMLGYFRQPGETAGSFTDDGYMRTGDLAMIDGEGCLHIVGRVKETIIRGGYNVHPREIEDHLRAHPAVEDAVVIGVPNEVLGELICAALLVVEGAIVSEEEVKEYCRTALAEYKVPDVVHFMSEFPMTGSGKPKRIDVARAVRAGTTAPEESAGD
jgi:fatty-acyl-CoA synthase